MERLDQEEITAEMVINSAVANGTGSSEIIAGLQKGRELLDAQKRSTIDSYIQSMRPIFAGMMVKDFSGNTAGMYDGSQIYVDRDVMQVGTSSIDTTIAQAQEVFDHESYHAKHHHTADMQIVSDTREGIAVVIGGKEFTDTALIEGLTVSQTGDRFVSDGYIAFKNTLTHSVEQAGLTIGDVEHAVNIEKDLTLIDDRTREQSPYAVTA